jgi:hypothetical protein
MAEGMRAARASWDNRWFAMVASSSRGDAELEVSSGATFWGSGGEEMVRGDVGLDDEAVQDGLGRAGERLRGWRVLQVFLSVREAKRRRHALLGVGFLSRASRANGRGERRWS